MTTVNDDFDIDIRITSAAKDKGSNARKRNDEEASPSDECSGGETCGGATACRVDTRENTCYETCACETSERYTCINDTKNCSHYCTDHALTCPW